MGYELAVYSEVRAVHGNYGRNGFFPFVLTYFHGACRGTFAPEPEFTVVHLPLSV